MSDGLFLKCIREIASQYPDIEYNEVIVDACCMQVGALLCARTHAHSLTRSLS